MEQKPKGEIVSLKNAVRARMERKGVGPASETLHLLSILKNHPEVVLRGTDVSVEEKGRTDDILLSGDTEVLYYTLLLQDPAVSKWDGEGDFPPPPWVNVNHPKVLRAQQLIDTHSLGPKKQIELYKDVVPVLWEKAGNEEKRNILNELLKNSRMKQWYQASGEPCPGEGYVQMDAPEIFRLLSPEWQAYVQQKMDSYSSVQREESA